MLETSLQLPCFLKPLLLLLLLLESNVSCLIKRPTEYTTPLQEQIYFLLASKTPNFDIYFLFSVRLIVYLFIRRGGARVQTFIHLIERTEENSKNFVVSFPYCRPSFTGCYRWSNYSSPITSNDLLIPPCRTRTVYLEVPNGLASLQLTDWLEIGCLWNEISCPSDERR